ncbi:MAG: PAS domain S-box protein [Candidatus Omnitrophica bacterium]|nr:PAS domain S-box protein [Candidatus Omnitrophota bacterium]
MSFLEDADQFSTFMDNFPGIAYRGKMDFTPVFLRGKVKDITGYDTGDFVRRKLRWVRIIHPDDAGRLRDSFEKIRSIPDFSCEREYRIIRKDRTIAWLHEHVRNICDKDGRPGFVEGVLFDISEMKLAEHRLRENEARFRTLVDHINSAIAVYRAVDDGDDFVFVGFNKAAEKIESVSNGAIIGKKVTEVFPGVKEFGLFDVFQRVWKTGVPEEHPVRLYKDNRISGWKSNYVSKLPSGEIVAIYEDVTGQKQAEERLQKSEALLKETQRISRVGGWELDVASGTMSWTDEVYRIYGVGHDFNPSDIARDISFYSPDCSQVVQDAFQQALHEGAPYDLELGFINAQGQHRWVRTMGTPVKAGGRVIKISGNIIDITDRKNAELALQQSEERYRRLFEEANDAIFLADVETRKILDCNQAALKLVGKTRKEVVGSHQQTLHPAESGNVTFGSACLQPISQCDGQTIEAKIVTGSGQIRDVAIKANILDLGGRKIVQGIFRDITERKKAEDSLQQAFRQLKETQEELLQSGKMAAMGKLAAGISHELNQPLTGIKGFAQAALCDLPKDDPLRADLKRIIEQSDRMNGIINNIRLFARRSDFVPRDININKPIEMALDLVKDQLKNLTITVEKQLGTRLPLLKADENQLQQVMVNLLGNASDAIECHPGSSSRKIRVSSSYRARDKTIEIQVSDTGCGISEENMRNIFTPFFTTKGKGKGMGLGLSIVYRIIESLNGKIDVKSKPGQGTTVTINLPIQIST